MGQPSFASRRVSLASNGPFKTCAALLIESKSVESVPTSCTVRRAACSHAKRESTERRCHEVSSHEEDKPRDCCPL